MRKSLLCALLLAGVALVASQTAVFSVLKSTTPLGKQAGDFYLLPTNQLLRPWGEQTVIAGRPVDMAFDSQKRILAVLDTRSVLLLDGSTGTRLAEVPAKTTSYAGIAWRPGNRELWASETTRNGPDSILIVEMSELGMPGKASRIDLRGHPVPTGIAFSPDGKTAYVAFSRANGLAVIDAATREIKKEVAVGIAPFGVAVSKQHGQIYVTNRGGRRPGQTDTTAPSSGTAVVTNPVTGSTTTGTVSIVDAETLAVVKEAPVGLAPSQLTLSPDEKTLAVANGHSDSVTLTDTRTLVHTDIRIPTWPEGTLGSQPIAVAFSADGKTLFTACGGNNAIAVLRQSGGSWKVAGATPTAWFPSAIAIDQEGALRVLNIKGVGNTANKQGTFNSRVFEGSLERMSAPTPLQVTAGTREVRAANGPVYEPAGGVANLPSLGIQHVFLIVKENRTYDQLFGDLPKGNNDPKLCMYGRDITPNHHALAERYVTLDNFYTGGAISFDGHQWLMQAFVSDYVERAFAASPRGYAWNMADALTVAPTGFFWQAASRPLSVRIYGEFQLPAKWDPATQSAVDIDERQELTWSEYWQAYKEGRWQTMVGSRSGVPALAPYCSQRYPNNTLVIPDQIRAEEFQREFKEHEKNNDLPHLNILTLNNDHTSGTRPGSPTPRAMVADNDLALGRIVETISNSQFWPTSLILVVEDDAQDGVDHVDGHRTVALAIGPHIRRNAVDSNNYNQTSMIRTIQEIFRIPQKTRFLKAARPMTSVFTADADTTPYTHLVPKQALDQMNPPLKALNGRQLQAAKQSLAMNFRDIDDAPQEILNRILWWDAKGYDTPYPHR
ncbi:MAG TPA: alkaline phosphatase family protein [Bryobacteraceae bacterium]